MGEMSGDVAGGVFGGRDEERGRRRDGRGSTRPRSNCRHVAHPTTDPQRLPTAQPLTTATARAFKRGRGRLEESIRPRFVISEGVVSIAAAQE